ncbi:MAG: hypothetical protein JZU49_00330 [Sulfuricurvum sp.]|nr:hypothetical protein [Sulfuricurvum sp.]
MPAKKPFMAVLTVSHYDDSNGTTISTDDTFELEPVFGQTLLELLKQQAKDGYTVSHLVSLAGSGSGRKPDEED